MTDPRTVRKIMKMSNAELSKELERAWHIVWEAMIRTDMPTAVGQEIANGVTRVKTEVDFIRRPVLQEE